jgi:hypothetical protein
LEVNKLGEADSIRVVTYPSWIANIIPVKNKNGQIKVCIDFQDLNQACSKDDFTLPIDTIKELMSYPKCRSVTVINNPARLGSNHKEVNCINYN